MKRLRKILLLASALCAACGSNHAAESAAGQKQIKIRIVNFKSCVEQSKMGKQEQSQFEGLKKQLESMMEQKEKGISDLSGKLNDADYLDSLSDQAVNELKHQYRMAGQEFAQQQNYCYQMLNQANIKVVQKLTEAVTQAASTVAKREGIDLVLNEESNFFYSPDLDITSKVVEELNRSLESQSSKEG